MCLGECRELLHGKPPGKLQKTPEDLKCPNMPGRVVFHKTGLYLSCTFSRSGFIQMQSEGYSGKKEGAANDLARILKRTWLYIEFQALAAQLLGECYEI